MRSLVVLFLVGWYILSAAGQDPETCEDVTEPDCSTVGLDCSELIPRPPPNTFSCFKLERDSGTPGPRECEQDVDRMPQLSNESLVSTNPTPCSAGGSTITYLIQPFLNRREQYANRQFCRFHNLCPDPFNSLISINIGDDDIALEPSQECIPGFREECVDVLGIGLPNAVCTVCGTDTSDECDVDMLLNQGYSGTQEIDMTFLSNDRGRCDRGFSIQVSCTSLECSLEDHPPINIIRSTPGPPGPPGAPGPPGFPGPRRVNCSTPDPVGFNRARGKRSVPDPDTMWEDFASRTKRSGFVQPIVVPAGAECRYRDFVLVVAVGNIWLQKFRNIQVFQVFNEVAGFRTFYGNAPTVFPGYGILKVGNGIAQFVQRLPSVFLPSPSEIESIGQLRRRVGVRLFELTPPILFETDGSGVGPDPSPVATPPPFADEELAELDEMAREFGNACNIFLRAAACTYQQLFLGGVLPNCLVSRSDPPTPRPKGRM